MAVGLAVIKTTETEINGLETTEDTSLEYNFP
jgi:hypothetical protein